MTPNVRRRVRRKSLFDRLFDWLNGCDLTQLDAIILVVFVFIGGVGVLAGCFVLGYVQACFAAHPRNLPPSTLTDPRALPRQWATIPTPGAPYAAYSQGVAGVADFGKPRYSAFGLQPGQAQAAGTGGY